MNDVQPTPVSIFASTTDCLVVLRPPFNSQLDLPRLRHWESMSLKDQAEALRQITISREVDDIEIEVVGMGQALLDLVLQFYPRAVGCRYQRPAKPAKDRLKFLGFDPGAGQTFVKWTATEWKDLMDRYPPMTLRPGPPRTPAERDALNTAILADAPKPRHPPEAELFYLQHVSYLDGNAAVWLQEGCEGYTSDLRKAQLFTKAEAQAMAEGSTWTTLWPKAEIERLVRPTVSVLDLKKAT